MVNDTPSSAFTTRWRRATRLRTAPRAPRSFTATRNVLRRSATTICSVQPMDAFAPSARPKLYEQPRDPTTWIGHSEVYGTAGSDLLTDRRPQHLHLAQRALGEKRRRIG